MGRSGCTGMMVHLSYGVPGGGEKTRGPHSGVGAAGPGDGWAECRYLVLVLSSARRHRRLPGSLRQPQGHIGTGWNDIRNLQMGAPANGAGAVKEWSARWGAPSRTLWG